MNFAQITVYDIVGYFFPGVFALFGMYLIACPLLTPLEQHWHVITPVKWCALALAAYVSGHCIQGVANWVDKRIRRTSGVDRILGVTSASRTIVVETAIRRAATSLQVQTADISNQMLYDVMDAYVLQYGKTEARDIYVYREGFYRGLFVAFALITLGLISRLFSHQLCTILGGRILLTNTLLYCILVPTLVSVIICYQRFRRFEAYRINFVLNSFLVLTTEPPRRD